MAGDSTRCFSSVIHASLAFPMAWIGMPGILRAIAISPRATRQQKLRRLKRATGQPGGLGQLIALRYGTLPIVHATGGLADTVTDLYADPDHGNGISFTQYTPSALLDALHRALRLYAEQDRWPDLVARAMAYDSRWSASARDYSQLYQRVLRLPPR